MVKGDCALMSRPISTNGSHGRPANAMVEYVIIDNKVKIVDEQTGRIMEGRRYSDGLHQAIEAKENVKVEAATQTYATITLQTYFRMYKKLAGMTGTAETEAGEFWNIYTWNTNRSKPSTPTCRSVLHGYCLKRSACSRARCPALFATTRTKFRALWMDPHWRTSS